MISAIEYREKNVELMTEYEQRVREWLVINGKKSVANKIPFFRDGVCCPEKWFQSGNEFRPLIVLKEVSLGINTVEELPEYLRVWGNPKYFEFVENPFDDVKVGLFTQWRRIARLIKGLEETHKGNKCEYDQYDFSYKAGEEYQGSVEGYLKYKAKTANEVYNDVIDKMAVLEIKKIGAGQTVGSELSIETMHYMRHIEPFEDLLCRQIELIDPTVIICCGRDGGQCISSLLCNIKNKTGDRLWIDGYHHTRSSNVHFYEEPLKVYEEFRKS